jgi:hypothetical protein
MISAMIKVLHNSRLMYSHRSLVLLLTLSVLSISCSMGQTDDPASGDGLDAAIEQSAVDDASAETLIDDERTEIAQREELSSEIGEFSEELVIDILVEVDLVDGSTVSGDGESSALEGVWTASIVNEETGQEDDLLLEFDGDGGLVRVVSIDESGLETIIDFSILSGDPISVKQRSLKGVEAAREPLAARVETLDGVNFLITIVSLVDLDSEDGRTRLMETLTAELQLIHGEFRIVGRWVRTTEILETNVAGEQAGDVTSEAFSTEGTLNQPPTADAGEDLSVADEDDDGSASVVLDGSGSSDPDGSIVSYTWKRGKETIGSGVSATVEMAVGAYDITLEVVDDAGESAADTVVATVNAAAVVPPTADAGADQSLTDSDRDGLESVSMDGAASSDSDGSIVSYSWRDRANEIAAGPSPSVDLAVGVHTITLVVTDDDGASDTDEVVITVEAGPNTPPTADAGPDQTVVDTDGDDFETVTLNGVASSDPDGSIAKYAWIEGSTTIATGISPTVNFAVGDHTIVLQITDDEGATASDTVTVDVDPIAGTILTFDIAGLEDWDFIPQDYGDRVDAETAGDYSYGGTANTPNVTVDYVGKDAETELTWWQYDHNDLVNIAFYTPVPAGGFKIVLVADANYEVMLHGFDVGNWSIKQTNLPEISVRNKDNDVLFSQSNIEMPRRAHGHLSFDFSAPPSGSQIIIDIDTTGMANPEVVGLDNIWFSQVPVN